MSVARGRPAALFALGMLAAACAGESGVGSTSGGSAAASFAPGATTACRRSPAFAAGLGFGSGAALSTHERQPHGLVIIDPSGASEPYQHDSWDDAGSLGPFVTDARGHVYVAATPRVNVLDNPPGTLGRVFRVDSQTGAMSQYVELPDSELAGQGNPFGIVGLAYDCDLDALFVSSVAGTSRADETGHVYRVDLSESSVTELLGGVDAFGLATVNTARGKRLYFALAREPEVWSVGLGSAGELVDEPRLEVTLGGGYVGRKIAIEAGPDRVVANVASMPFAFDLRAASERLERIEVFALDQQTGALTPMPAAGP